jgi:hypothetical protein
MDSRLKSEQVVVSAPMSFHGSAARIWKITESQEAAKKILLALVALALIFLVWCFVLIWYLIFGIFLVPYRLLRRGQRKRKIENLRHREMMEAINNRPD